MDNSYGLEKIQQRLLETLLYFDRICRENGIHYSLHGGTLLGAVRNHQFIPWDDDVDVSMSREEYKKFKTIISMNQYQEAILYEDILWFSRFVYITEGTPVFIDIFIYDFISDNKLFAFLKINLLRGLQGIIKPKDNLDFQKHNVFYCMLTGITFILGRLFSQKRKRDWYQVVSENCFLGQKNMIHRSNDSFYGLPYIFDKDFMKDYTEIELEGHSFMANTQYEEFLRRNYGENYLTPPPDKERCPQHAVIRKRISKKLDAIDESET